MPLSLSGQSIQSAVGDSGTYTWADVLAVGSTQITSHTDTNGRTFYRVRCRILLRGTCTLTVTGEHIEFLRVDSTNTDNLGSIRVEGSARCEFSECGLIFRHCSTVWNNSNRYHIYIQALTAVVTLTDCAVTFDKKPGTGSTRIDINITNATRCLFVSQMNPDDAAVQWYGSLTDCTAKNCLLETGPIATTPPTITNTLTFDPTYGVGNWTFTRMDVRDFSIGGTPITAASWQSSLNYFDFIDTSIDMTGCRMMTYDAAVASAENNRIATHRLRAVSSGSPVSGVAVRYSGYSTQQVSTDGSGLTGELKLVYQRTNFQSLANPGAWTVYPLPTPVVGHTSYTRAIFSYAHQPLVESLTVGSKVGSSAAPFDIGLTVDQYVTASETTARAYTSVTTLDQAYDALKVWVRDNLSVAYPSLGAQLATAIGDELNFGNRNVVVTTGGTVAVSINSGTNTITIRVPSSLGIGAKLKTIRTTGTVSGPIAPGVIVTSSAGTTGLITATILPTGSSVAVYNQAGTRVSYVASTSGTETIAVPAGVTGSYRIKAMKHGSIANEATVTVTGGGLFTASVICGADTGITQSNAATVAAYAALDNADKLYDYAAYFETTSVGIDYARPASKAGAACDLGSKDLTIDATLGSVYSYAGAGVLIKASVYGDGSTYTSTTTSGSVTLANGAVIQTVVASSAGTTGVWTFSGLSANNLYVEDGSAVERLYATNITGSRVLYIAAGATGAWRWRSVRYGQEPTTGTVTVTGGGRFSTSITNAADPKITQAALATVLGYTTLENWDKFYDYCQAYLTTTGGKALGKFATASGSAVDLGSVNYTADATAGSAFALSGGITAKATNVAAGSTFQGLTTTGTVAVANGARIDTWYTSAAGRSVLILAPNIISGTRYRIYNVTDAAQIDNSTATASGISYRLIWTADKTVRLTTRYVNAGTAKQRTSSTGVLTSTGLVFLDTQSDDTIYNANGVHGVSCDSGSGGEFTADFPNVQIDVNDSDNTTTLARTYAWACYQESTANGISNFFAALTATDTANYAIDGSVVDLAFDNRKTALLTITGGYITKTGGAAGLVAATTVGSIYFDSGKAFIASGGPTEADIAAAVWQRVIEGSLTAENIQRLMLAMLAGKATVPAGAGSFAFRDQADSKNRIAGTTDANGARTVTAVDAS